MKRYLMYQQLFGLMLTSAIMSSNILAADRVAVVPLGGAIGNATSSDVLLGKTFSTRLGKGLVGTLEIREDSTIYTNSIGMQFSLIPAGSFIMGSPAGTVGANYPVWPAEMGRETPSDEKQHVVNLHDFFYMQITEVTQGQWQQVMSTNPSVNSGCGSNCPVENINWDDAHIFINALNALEGRINCNTTPNNCYALPTEAQWEYAARAGTVSAFYSGPITTYLNCSRDANLDKIGWYCGNSSHNVHPVAQKEPNNFGLYDMSGNVWEWCKDWHDVYPDGPVDDPAGGSGSNREIRGGAWREDADGLRSADRGGDRFGPDYRGDDVGLRLTLSPGQ